MRTREIIVCSECKKTHCTVEELFEPEKLSMEEYARRYGKTFPMNFYSSGRTARRFLITCQDCGYQYEFLERIEGLQTIPASDCDAYKVTYNIPEVTNYE